MFQVAFSLHSFSAASPSGGACLWQLG